MKKPETQQAGPDEALATLRKTVDAIKVAMLTTITPDQQLRSRPLHTAEMDEQGHLWFLVAAAGGKVDEIFGHEGHIGISYSDVAHQYYVSLTGTAELIQDRARKTALWGPVSEAWFPGGKDDAGVALLKIIPERGEYWAGPRTSAGQLFAFARAAMTGNTKSFGDNKKFEVQKG